MAVIHRHQQILDILEDKRYATVHQLCEALYASGATIRRDLADLEKKGLISRVRGGAVLGDGSSEKPFMLRSGENRDKKLALCAVARALVRDGDTLFMDSSSTVALFAAHLRDVRGLSVVTNGLKTVNALNEYTDAKVYCSGGIIQDSSSMWGETALESISRYRASMIFFSCKGLDPQNGVTDSSEENAQIKRHMLRGAGKKILLCDSSKFSKTFFCRICALEEIDILVTDQKPADEYFTHAPCRILYPDPA